MRNITAFLFTCVTSVVFAQDSTTWHDVTEWGVEGLSLIHI